MTRQLTVEDLPQLQRVVDAAMEVVTHAETKNDLLGLTMYVLESHIYGLWDRLAELRLGEEPRSDESPFRRYESMAEGVDEEETLAGPRPR